MIALNHRHGGSIVAITGIGHETDRGVAEWYFIGDTHWSDGSQSLGKPISPICVQWSTPEQKEEIDRLMSLMTKYLERNGEWHDMKHKRDGRAYSWTPKKAKHQESLT